MNPINQETRVRPRRALHCPVRPRRALHCPRDLTHDMDFRDNLPTLLDRDAAPSTTPGLQETVPSTNMDAIFQENYELKERIDVLEKMNKFLKCDINDLTQQQPKESTKLLNVQEELDKAYLKIKNLESTLEEERLQFKREIKEMKEAQATRPAPSTVVVPDEEQLNLLRLQIETLEMKKDDNESAIQELMKEKATLAQKLMIETSEKQALQHELSEIKEHLDQKNLEIHNINIALEELKHTVKQYEEERSTWVVGENLGYVLLELTLKEKEEEIQQLQDQLRSLKQKKATDVRSVTSSPRAALRELNEENKKPATPSRLFSHIFRNRFIKISKMFRSLRCVWVF
jgi:predicted  nucleic acid-binding Zn-ribbon protein